MGKSVPWDSDLYAKFPADPQKTLKAIDKVLVMASAMDGKALQTAVEAHHKAIGSMDGKGVTSLADYTAINDALGRVIAGVPEKLTKDVFYAFGTSHPRTCQSTSSRRLMALPPTKLQERSSNSRTPSR